jgi:hypothetical protein
MFIFHSSFQMQSENLINDKFRQDFPVDKIVENK